MAEAGEDAEESLMKPPSPLNRKHTVTAEPCSQLMWSSSPRSPILGQRHHICPHLGGR
jgi:hypothetical protein